MKTMKRSLCVLLSIAILTFGVCTSYLSPHKIDEVHAVGATVLTEELAWLISAFFGSYVYGYGSGGEANSSISMDDLAKAGHDFLQRCNPETYPIEDSDIADSVGNIRDSNTPLGSLFYNGQSYVFGTEALDEVAGMDFSVIQGGGNDDDDPDEESKLKKFAKSGIALTMSGAILVGNIMPLWVTELMHDIDAGNIETEPDYNYTNGFNGYIYEDGLYYFHLSFTVNQLTFILRDTMSPASTPYFLAYNEDNNLYLYMWYQGKSSRVNIGLQCYKDGVAYYTTSYGYIDFDHVTNFGTDYPIFESLEIAEEAMLAVDYSSALNYAKTYEIADWLSDDWSGTLYDPLTGLNTGSEWYTLVRQGLASTAFASDPSSETYRSSIRDFFVNAKENRTEDTAPYVDSALSPIYIPSTLPEVKIDPEKEEAVKPKVADPVSSVIPNPSTGEDTDISEDIEDIADYVPELADDLSGVGDSLKKKFPFSIPWDIYYILNGLATTPKAPYFELPLKVERYGIDETIIVDMARFQVLSDLSRSIFSILFMIVLINLSIKVIGSIKEES